jgi:hypothetical protein
VSRTLQATEAAADQGHMEKSWTRIVMPGGRTIEVLLLGQPLPVEQAREDAPSVDPPAGAQPSEVRHERPLHSCPECESGLVYPIAWEESGREHWSIELRCPACEWRGGGTFPQRLADDFDEELDRGTAALVHDLDRLTRANMAEEVERFAHALEADAIAPMDF